VIETVGEQGFDTGLEDAELAVAVDAIIRLVLSHVMQPVKAPADAAADITWVAGHVLHDVSRSRG